MPQVISRTQIISTLTKLQEWQYIGYLDQLDYNKHLVVLLPSEAICVTSVLEHVATEMIVIEEPGYLSGFTNDHKYFFSRIK